MIAPYHIAYDDRHGLVSMKWTEYATSEEFRQGTELMLQLLIQYNCSTVFADISEMTLIGSSDQHWLEFNFLPRAVNAGFKKVAFLKPQSYFNAVAVETVCERIHPGVLTIRFYDSEEDAISWLS
jgi:hypothetical protein